MQLYYFYHLLLSFNILFNQSRPSYNPYPVVAQQLYICQLLTPFNLFISILSLIYYTFIKAISLLFAKNNSGISS